ncbi:MAG: CNP1-like family protein [Zoogloeaceae bacterium]|jgi:hypothetical protein|nr:CNP1-like family protein [Zoogloeaceae bacterium]
MTQRGTIARFLLRAFAGSLLWICVLPGWARENILNTRPETYTSDEDENPAKPWAESAVELPEYPNDADFYSFYVSAGTTSRFYLDAARLRLDSDGVARYTLLVISPSGVRNVSYEGMRCQTRERRIYALGRPAQKTWSPARGARWSPVRETPVLRHHAALYQDFLCPDGILASRVDEVTRRIRKEGEPLEAAP